MAKYVVFIYDDEAQLGSASADVIQSTVEGHQKFAERHGGSLRGGGRVAPSAAAVSIRPGSDGAPATRQPGPFLGHSGPRITGYYIIEAGDIDEAVEMASDVPAPFGGVEVRSLV
jgi:hypothetical protein